MIGGLVARHSIDVLRAPLVDDGRGNMTRDWPNVKEHTVRGWAVDAGATLEDEANRDGAAAEYKLYGPFAADVEPTDRVRLFGSLFTIIGGVSRQPGPSPLTSHTILRLIRWEG